MQKEDKSWAHYFIDFASPISDIEQPKQFTFPFNYQPHELCKIAAAELQMQLRKNTAKGRMYGVLVVKTNNGKLGYLAALSGSNYDDELFNRFVPPVYNLSNNTEFYREGEEELKSINEAICLLEKSEELIAATENFVKVKKLAEQELNTLTVEYKNAKAERQQKRKLFEPKSDEDAYNNLCSELIKQSQKQKGHLGRQKKYWKAEIEKAEQNYKHWNNKLLHLRNERKTKSANLQQQVFNQYFLLNANGKKRSLLDIFQEAIGAVPPSAAGECAAPKLLQFAFKHGLKPIAMAEFWWGASPKSEVRKHGNFYPACQSKCKPILGHMLIGIDVEPDPWREKPKHDKNVKIVFEDDLLLVINKPHGLLSVPGKGDLESVFSQMQAYLPKASGPLIVHRLDMATSGLMLIAKNKTIHEALQKQFLTHSIKKRYVALLNGILNIKSTTIELPLRVDLDNRPQQLVCYEHGKPAKTICKVVGYEKEKTRVHFYPITGRTHQLRVHAAHQQGLNMPIVGDELYGEKSDRLHLHAERIEFVHPLNNKKLSFTCKAEF